MPWKETTWMDQRMRFVADVTSCRYTMSELCRLYGISRKTGYKWAQRYGEEGVDGLKERSRRPHRCPRQTEARCEEALVAERRAHPRWGARKLLARLRRKHPDWGWPSPSTAAALLKRHGLVAPRRARRSKSHLDKPELRFDRPNDLWTADFKGEFRTADRQLCYPLTVADRYTGTFWPAEIGGRPRGSAWCLRGGVPCLRPAGGDSHRWRTAVCRSAGSSAAIAAGGLVGQARHPADAHRARAPGARRQS